LIFDRQNKKKPRVFFTGDFILFFIRYCRKKLGVFVYFKLDYIISSDVDNWQQR
jgi:hypothetical protein